MTDEQWKDIQQATEVVCSSVSIDRVDGKGFKVYKVKDTIRIDIQHGKKEQ